MEKANLIKRVMLCTAMPMMASAAFAQHVITGTVSDDNGPLIGATVYVKDAKQSTGTVTDLDGKFSITVPNNKSMLVVSYIGYETTVVPTDKKSKVSVTMIPEDNMLQETVVIGYGTQQKSHLTGSISKINGDVLANAPVSDVTQALQGVMTGITVNNNTSEVGVTPSVRVRGTGSISADNEPLVIIDGFPVQGGLQSINANDIKSIEILKDAASAAIYGSRATNGVILITTKSGTPDQPKYSFKLYSGVKYAYKLHDMMTSTETYNLLLQEEALGGLAPQAKDRSAAYLESQLGATDWQKQGLRSAAYTTNAQMSVQGGKKDTKYFVSAAYTKDQGIMEHNSLDKLTFRGKLDTKLSKAVTMGVNFSGTYRYTERPKNNFIDFYRTPSFLPVYHNAFTTELTGYTGMARGNHFNNIMTPTGPADENGNPTMEKSSPFSTSNNNPWSVMKNTKRWGEDMQGIANLYFTVNIAKGLQFKTSNGVNVRFRPDYYYGNKNATKDAEDSQATYFSQLYIDLLTENTLNYHTDFGSDKQHSIDALLGYTAERTRDQRVALTASGFATDDIHTLNAAKVYSLASQNNGNNAGTGTYRYPDLVLESYLGRVNYSYMGKYLASASIRLDRSSLFSDGHRNAWFPSLSLGWRMSEEKFMKGIKAINNLKLRASYGVTGNNRIQYQAATEFLNSANYSTGLGNGTLVSGVANTSDTMANPNITWEKTDEFNYGIDLGMWNNRLSLSIDAYYSVTRALLFAQPTQSFTGFNYYWNNIGKVRNSGLEILLDTRNIQRRNFTWDTSINFSLSRNKLLELGGERQMISQGERNECYLSRVGSPLIQFYGYKTAGVWKSAEEIAASPHFSDDVPGGMHIVDTNHDGQLTPEDRVPLGNPYPDFTWGITNTFKIGQFDVSFLIQGVQGVKVVNGDAYYTETMRYNKAYTKNRFVCEEHPGNGKTPYMNYGHALMLTDFAIEDASYTCLRNFTVGYSLPRKSVRKMGLNNLRFYVTGSNLLYIWSGDYRGINPESRMTTGAYSSQMIAGYQRGGFPLTSTITAGFDINF